jgi:ATP-dependent DNA helicase RecG
MDKASYTDRPGRCQPPAAQTLAQIRAPLTSLAGIGPRLADPLKRLLGGGEVLDLLLHMPDSYIDRRERPSLRAARPGRVVTLAVQVMRHDAPQGRNQPWRVVVTDGTAFADIVLFHQARLSQMPVGAKLVVSGKLEAFGNKLTLPHPDYVLPEERAGEMPAIEPVWPLTAGVTNRVIGRAMADAMRRLPQLPEWIDPPLVARERWPDFATALRLVQCPSAEDKAPERESGRRRLAYDELFAEQLSLALGRQAMRARPGRSLTGDGHWRAEALRRFGFEPTPSQHQALAEIDRDMGENRPMLRLLQGDVGSGKTLVALLAMLRAAEARTQSAMMAPTELLAQQHYRTLSALSPVPVGLLTGSVSPSARREVLAGLADGSLPIVIGTHALFQASVTFQDLGLAVIDEQHRFGVKQRISLGDKGDGTDVLVMTATPIPRTLLLTQWAEMEVSRLTEKPRGRGPLRTTIHPTAAMPEVIRALARALEGAARIYWVCPLVSESEVLDVAAAEERFSLLRSRFGDAVGLAHGRQETRVREAVLADFAAGRIRLLVATTVVEVGVDVPEATVMVIEHAERFGLAQLHQLRGRVGRGTAESFCLLLHEDDLNPIARERLTLLRDTQDGFLIADADFRLRGSGEATGTRQSGLPGYRLADVPGADELREIANKDAAVLLERDSRLVSARGLAAGRVLAIFGKEDGLARLHAG